MSNGRGYNYLNISIKKLAAKETMPILENAILEQVMEIKLATKVEIAPEAGRYRLELFGIAATRDKFEYIMNDKNSISMNPNNTHTILLGARQLTQRQICQKSDGTVGGMYI